MVSASVQVAQLEKQREASIKARDSARERASQVELKDQGARDTRRDIIRQSNIENRRALALQTAINKIRETGTPVRGVQGFVRGQVQGFESQLQFESRSSDTRRSLVQEFGQEEGTRIFNLARGGSQSRLALSAMFQQEPPQPSAPLQTFTPIPEADIIRQTPFDPGAGSIGRLTGQQAPVSPIQSAIARQSFAEPTFQPVPPQALTIGQLERQAQVSKAQSLVREFQELTPEEAVQKAESGERGFVGQSTVEGTKVFFNVEELAPEIKEAGKQAVSGAGFGSRDFLLPGQDQGIAPVVFDIFRGKGKERLERERLRTGEEVVGRLKVGLEGAEITSEFFKEAITGGTFKDKPEVFGVGDDIGFFDTGISKKIKEEPLSDIGAAEQIRFVGQIGTAGLVTSPLVIGESIPITKRVGATVSELTPVRLKPGTFTAPPPSSQSDLNKIVAEVRGFQFSSESGKDIAFVGRGRGLVDEDLDFLTFGRTFGDDSVNVVRLKQPTIEIGRSGAVSQGTIETLEFGLPQTTSGKFTSTARLARINNRDVLKEFSDVSRITDRITKRSSFVGLERDPRPIDISENLFAEDFLFASGRQPGIKQFDLLDIPSGLQKSPKSSQGILVADATRFDSSIFGRFRLIQPRVEDLSGTRVFGMSETKKPKTISFQLTQNEQANLLGGVESATQKALSKQSIQIATKTKPTEFVLDELPGSGVFGVLKQQPSAFAGTGQFERTNFETFSVKRPTTVNGNLGTIQTDFTGGRTDFGGVFTPLELPRDSQDFVNKGVGTVKLLGGTIIDTPSKGRLFGGSLQGSPPLSIPKQPSIQLTGLITGTTQGVPTKSITEGTTDTPFIGLPSFRSPPPPRAGIFAFPPPLPGTFDFPKPRAKGKRKFRRTPSLISLPSQLGIDISGFGTFQERTGLVPRGLIAPKKRKKKRK